jgi:hypothetical protein
VPMEAIRDDGRESTQQCEHSSVILRCDPYEGPCALDKAGGVEGVYGFGHSDWAVYGNLS